VFNFNFAPSVSYRVTIVALFHFIAVISPPDFVHTFVAFTLSLMRKKERRVFPLDFCVSVFAVGAFFALTVCAVVNHHRNPSYV
jgi:hypothetical protein